MADLGQEMGSLVILIENVPDIEAFEGHDFESVINHFIDKGYHMVHN